jgi:hypothetical protein
MTPDETLVLARYVKACCPQQTMDKYTPDAWHDLLGDLSFEDCRAAVVEVARRQPFVAPSEIRDGVKAIRSERLRVTPVPAPPAELLDDADAYRAYLRAAARRIADGEPARQGIGGRS